jgi:hypothetical protein
MLFRVNKITSFVADQLPKLRATLDDLEQALDKRLDAFNYADGSVTTAILADGAVTPAKISGTPQTTSLTVTGDGTANRVISLGFTPRYVMLVRVSNGTIFEALGDGTTALTNWWRLAAGTQQNGAAMWQGIVSGGIKCGSNVGSDSNVNTEIYYCVAYR